MTTFEALRHQLNGIRQVNGVTPVDILQLPEDLHAVVRKMLKRTMSAEELGAELLLPADQARAIGDLLVDKGFLQTETPVDGAVRYKILFTRMHTHNIPQDL